MYSTTSLPNRVTLSSNNTEISPFEVRVISRFPLNFCDSFLRRKLENRAPESCRLVLILSSPITSFELHAKMAEEIDLEKCKFRNPMTLTLDWVEVTLMRISGRGLPTHQKERKGKERKSIYIAHFCTKVHTKRSDMDHTVLPANNTMPAFPPWRSPQHLRQQTSNCSSLLIYRPRKYERLSWPSWLTYSGWLTHISGHPSATSRAQDSESTSAKDQCSTAGPRHVVAYTVHCIRN